MKIYLLLITLSAACYQSALSGPARFGSVQTPVGPFEQGNAVYRARPIHSIWEPNAVFNDRLLGMQGYYKSQNSGTMDFDSLIEGRIEQLTAANHTNIIKPADNSTK